VPLHRSLEEVVLDVERGSHSAFSELVQATGAQLFQLLSRLLNAERAKDALQETYARVWAAARRGGYRRGAGVEAWVRRIAVNHALDQLRRQPLVLEARSFDGERHTHARLALHEVLRWISELPDEQRVVLVLKELEGLSMAQVAATLAISEGAAEQRLVRARATLRKRERHE
jgi:RNA polymerase sigma-70 factor (ECF subfamily)